jgi:hypothetical protein
MHIRSILRVKSPFKQPIDNDGAVHPARVDRDAYQAAEGIRGLDGSVAKGGRAG